ncbi:hypothetical protein ACFX2I_027252 [Malus domestica]
MSSLEEEEAGRRGLRSLELLVGEEVELLLLSSLLLEDGEDLGELELSLEVVPSMNPLFPSVRGRCVSDGGLICRCCCRT